MKIYFLYSIKFLEIDSFQLYRYARGTREVIDHFVRKQERNHKKLRAIYCYRRFRIFSKRA